jgi:hypothetical protein
LISDQLKVLRTRLDQWIKPKRRALIDNETGLTFNKALRKSLDRETYLANSIQPSESGRRIGRLVSFTVGGDAGLIVSQGSHFHVSLTDIADADIRARILREPHRIERVYPIWVEFSPGPIVDEQHHAHQVSLPASRVVGQTVDELPGWAHGPDWRERI